MMPRKFNLTAPPFRYLRMRLWPPHPITPGHLYSELCSRD